MPQTKFSPSELQEQDRKLWKGLGRFIDRIAPTLFEVGVWIFGSLIAFNLLVLASLFTIGPVDLSIKIATIAFALDLPLNLAGLIMLRLVQELKGSGFENQLVQAFKEEGYISDQIPQPPDLDAALTEINKRRMSIVLQAASVAIVVSLLLTLAGMISTLWYMAWWISVAFIAMIVACLITLILIMVRSQPPESQKPAGPDGRDLEELPEAEK